jgi:hypothetical protein
VAANLHVVRANVVERMESGEPERVIDLAPRDAAIKRMRPSWLRRMWEQLRIWFGRGYVETRACGRMPVRGKAGHMATMRFARESGNEALLECLKPR